METDFTTRANCAGLKLRHLRARCFLLVLQLGSQLLQPFAGGGFQAAVGLLLYPVRQDRDHQVAAQSLVSGFGEQFLPESK